MIKAPYLVQRAEIQRPLGDYRGKMLSQAVNLDYMGSASFEFGALPKSLRRLQALKKGLVLRVENSIKEGEAPLRVYSALTDEEYAEYLPYLHMLREDKQHTEERTEFNVGSYKSKYSVTDFWWDIENDVMWSFDKSFMKGIADVLQASFDYMDKPH